MKGLTKNNTFFMANNEQRKNVIKAMAYLVGMLNDEELASTFDYYFSWEDEEADDFKSLEKGMTEKDFDILVDEFVNAMRKANK